MISHSYLLVSFNDTQYAIDAKLVREIFDVPEIILIAEAPRDIIGVINIRSRIVPIVHLGLRLGYSKQKIDLYDSIIIIELDNMRVGLLVNSVKELVKIEPSAIESHLSYPRINASERPFIKGIAKLNRDIIILELKNLLLNPDAVIALTEEAKNSELTSDFYKLCSVELSVEDKNLFRERAERLRQIEREQELEKLIPIAALRINNQYFGIDLNLVREFTKIRNYTLIPKSPNYLLGTMNLRGEILTLLDLRPALNLPSDSFDNQAKVVVFEYQESTAGFLVNEVFDVVYFQPSEINSFPDSEERKLSWTARYKDSLLSAIDLNKLLNNYLVTNK
jgi:purine-binding chemotaxis protein CheW